MEVSGCVGHGQATASMQHQGTYFTECCVLVQDFELEK